MRSLIIEKTYQDGNYDFYASQDIRTLNHFLKIGLSTRDLIENGYSEFKYMGAKIKVSYGYSKGFVLDFIKGEC